jgi:hypothetical protein
VDQKRKPQLPRRLWCPRPPDDLECMYPRCLPKRCACAFDIPSHYSNKWIALVLSEPSDQIGSVRAGGLARERRL